MSIYYFQIFLLSKAKKILMIKCEKKKKSCSKCSVFCCASIFLIFIRGLERFPIAGCVVGEEMIREKVYGRSSQLNNSKTPGFKRKNSLEEDFKILGLLVTLNKELCFQVGTARRYYSSDYHFDETNVLAVVNYISA